MEKESSFKEELVEFLRNFLPFVLVLGFAAFVGLAKLYASQREYEQQLKLEKTRKQLEQVIFRSCNLKRLVAEGEKLKEGESKIFSFVEFCKSAKVNGDYDLLLLYKVAGVKAKKVDHGIVILTPAYIGKDFNSWEEELERLTGKYIPLPTVKEVLQDSDLAKNPGVVISDSSEVVR